MTIEKRKNIAALVCALAGFAVLAAGAWLNPINRFAHGFAVMACAVVLYFAIALLVADKNWLDIRGVFAGVWLMTIGMGGLRLTEYQEQWQAKTWLMFALAYLAFQIGATAGIRKGAGLYDKIYGKAKKFRFGRVSFGLREDRLFWICVVTTLIGLASFIANILIKGYIPCFSDDIFAYSNFYTKFHVFAVAATGVSGLCYYCVRTQKLSLIKKAILLLCIFYLVFVFPIMVVSRGVFVVAALSLATAIFYLHRKKLIALILSVIVILGVYLFASTLRNYSDAYLAVFFEPAEITLSESTTVQTESPMVTEDTQPTETVPVIEEPVQNSEPVFALSPKMAFLYGYLTVGHDNLNEAVQNMQNMTYGVRQFVPFNVILRIPALQQLHEHAEIYFVRPHLNTYNLIGDYYYDFGSLGVALCTLVWAFVFGLIQAAYEKGKGPFFLLILGNTMTPVALCFFASWTSNFTQWMLWGEVLIFALAACLTVDKKKQ